MTDLPALLRDSEFRRRLLLTLGAFGIYCLGIWIPIPGVDMASLIEHYQPGSLSSAIQRLSVLALGMTPMLSALVLIEIGMMAWPPMRKWATTSAPNARSLDGWVIVLTLAIAGFQANGVAVGLEGIDGLVHSPGLAFRAGVIATLVAGTALLAWMASLVTRYGLGSGFLLLLAAPLLMALPSLLPSQVLAWGEASRLSIPLTLAVFLAAAYALVLAGRMAPTLAGTGQLLWPVLVAYTIAPLLLVSLLLVFPDETFFSAIESLKFGQPWRVLIFPALTLVFYCLRARSLAHSGLGAEEPTRWVLPAALAVFAVALSELLIFSLPAPLALDGRNVTILVAFAVAILGGLGLRHSSAASPDSQSQPTDTI
jgi:preprotein translocase subunit SecY